MDADTGQALIFGLGCMVLAGFMATGRFREIRERNRWEREERLKTLRIHAENVRRGTFRA